MLKILPCYVTVVLAKSCVYGGELAFQILFVFVEKIIGYGVCLCRLAVVRRYCLFLTKNTNIMLVLPVHLEVSKLNLLFFRKLVIKLHNCSYYNREKNIVQ